MEPAQTESKIPNGNTPIPSRTKGNLTLIDRGRNGVAKPTPTQPGGRLQRIPTIQKSECGVKKTLLNPGPDVIPEARGDHNSDTSGENKVNYKKGLQKGTTSSPRKTDLAVGKGGYATESRGGGRSQKGCRVANDNELPRAQRRPSRKHPLP